MNSPDIMPSASAQSRIQAQVLSSALFEGGSGRSPQEAVAIAPARRDQLPSVVRNLASLAPANLPLAGRLSHARNMLVDMLQTAYIEQQFGPRNLRWTFAARKLTGPRREMRTIVLDGERRDFFFDHSAIPSAA